MHTSGPRSAAVDLADLIAPIEPASFLKSYWETKPLVLLRDDPRRYAGLFCFDDVDFVLSSLAKAGPGQSAMASLVVDGSRVPVSFGGTSRDSVEGLDGVLRRIMGGATLLIERIERFTSPLLSFSERLQRTLHARVGINLYLTPEAAQGFDAHFDSHDVFILQISGTKDWRIFGSPVHLPLPGMSMSQKTADLGQPEHEVRLREGDLLYIPRGFAHEARTTTTHSLHLTVGITVPKWIDLLTAALSDLATRDERLRRSVPVGLMEGERAPGAEQFSMLLSWFARTADVSTAAEQLRREWVSGRPPSLSEIFRDEIP
jgi:ribosomal protein L16 Arg81 hydroxylase